MDQEQLTKDFFSYIEKAQWDKVDSMMDENFSFSGATPFPVGKGIWLSYQQAVLKAFPDWAYNIQEISKEGESVSVKVHITGTHTNELHLPLHSVLPITATGIKIELPDEKSVLTFKEGKVLEIRVELSDNGGITGIMNQLKVD